MGSYWGWEYDRLGDKIVDQLYYCENAEDYDKCRSQFQIGIAYGLRQTQ